MKIELDLSNYATKGDLIDVDRSKFAKKIDLASLKSNVHNALPGGVAIQQLNIIHCFSLFCRVFWLLFRFFKTLHFDTFILTKILENMLLSGCCLLARFW